MPENIDSQLCELGGIIEAAQAILLAFNDDTHLAVLPTLELAQIKLDQLVDDLLPLLAIASAPSVSPLDELH